MYTIKDVALKAGLSQATVSRVINNHPYVSEDKKRAVQKAMDELGFVPNSSAQRLRNIKTKKIAVLISRIVNPFFSQLVDAMEQKAARHGYQLILCNTRISREKELEYFQLLKSKQVDGIIMASVENDWSVIEPYTKYGPIIYCNEYDPNASVTRVRLDQVEGGYIGTKHLLDKGHRKIGYCQGNDSSVSVNRRKGYLKAVTEAGIEPNPDWMFKNIFTIDDGRAIFRRIADMNDAPTALFTGSDEVAAGVIKEAQTHGWKVPDDLAVIGFDDQPIASLLDPQITTINQFTSDIGETAMKVMLEIVQGKRKNNSTDILLPIQLIERQST
ncbi:LacI family DNA-binding transcriptional regulator [Jeotgalibacillus sp. R-1-5s-1]|uniref:LacI family DNA-binding transcriptional regulator n=1 Tax=Jeotgalibacillus sp. R-1-5s-1 TaxID=2555897 RepID=UPI00106D192D|nr:LacI family DNA-binding transcriptional regulator [Jeotgalibacillus sp. R-1-5s-1]TFD99886.1 LacI family transcriptional regulator [Jeotgalibacillus sp. R-1-5s-1]